MADALDNAKDEEAFVVIDDWGEPFVVCGLCKMKHDDEMAALDSDRLRFSVTADGEPYCRDCVALWYERFSRGSLSAAIAKSRLSYAEDGPNRE
ncbi:MAG TPA: hypothetical protein VK034_05520 [Enhygromyxa sp.]|nr:hypothetical protein [Enhygromyxa sp.]